MSAPQPATFRGAFDSFLAATVNLRRRERLHAQTSHNALRGTLKSKALRDPKLFNVMSGYDFLTGSFDRGTKIRPLDDVDVFLVLDGAGLFLVRDGVIANVAIDGTQKLPNPVMSPRYLISDGYVSSSSVLKVLRNTLAETYPASKIRRDGQAVNVWFGSYGMGLDVVPAFHITPFDSSPDHYYIPAGHDSHLWIPTNPKQDASFVQQWEDYHNGLFRPTVRLIKWWNRLHNRGRLRSYHVEVMCLYAFRDQPIDDYGAALTAFFLTAQALVQGECPDPTGLGAPITSELSDEGVQATLAALQRAHHAASQARAAAAASRIRLARAWWQKVLGPRFGVPVLGIPAN